MRREVRGGLHPEMHGGENGFRASVEPLNCHSTGWKAAEVLTLGV